MMQADELLSRLRRVPGVAGAMMVTAEGFLVAAETGLGGRSAEETAAAVVANLGKGVGGALQRLGRGELKHLAVSGAGGRLVLVRAGSGYLAALLDNEANLGLAQLELAGAAVEAARKMTR